MLAKLLLQLLSLFEPKEINNQYLKVLTNNIVHKKG